MTTEERYQNAAPTSSSITVLCTTIGRAGLPRMLASLSKQAWRDGDRVIVVHDGVASEQTRALCRDVRLIELPEGPHRDYGHTPRNKVMPLITAGYICHLDDDDMLAPDAIAAMREQIDESPGSIFLFRMQDTGGHLYWSNKTQILSNVGTGCVVHPATIDLAEFDPSHYGGDGLFIEETIRRNPATPVVWVDRVTYLIRPKKKLRIACICPSYRRPECLQTTLAQFQSQVLETCEAHLFILEDSGLRDSQYDENWGLISVPERFQTFGQKFNHACGAAKLLGFDAVVVMEDDDIYLPGHVEAHAKVLATHRYSVPSRKAVDCHRKRPIGLLEWSDLREETNPLPTGLHGSWAFRLDLWEEVGGYPEEAMDGFDLEFGRRLMATGGVPGDYCEFTSPQYGYRWSSAPGKNCRNASAYSSDGQLYYERAAEQGDTTDQHGRKLTPMMDAGALEFSRLMREHYAEPKAVEQPKPEEQPETDALFFWLDSMKKCVASGQYALFAVGKNPDGTFTQYPLKQEFPDDMRVWAIGEMRKAMCAD